MADIAINPVTRRVQFIGNTGLGPFAFTFNILQQSDIVVYKNDDELILTSEYTVSINANGTGSVTLTGSGNGTSLGVNDILTIVGGRELSRTTDFVTSGDLLAASLNEQLDSQVIMAQQIDEKTSRALKIAPSEQTADMTIPSTTSRANKYMSFNADGTPNVSSKTVAQVEAAVDVIDGLSGGTVSSSDDVTFLNTDSDAVIRSVQSKLQEYVSVTDFGAVGDGVADDTTAIQNALDTKRHVFIPGGVYKITATLKPHRNQIISGEGAVQRGYLNEPSVTRLNVATDVTCFDTQPNIAIGCQFKNMVIKADDQTNGSGKYGIKMGTTASDPGGGSNQAIKCRLEDLHVSGFDICFGHFGWSWEVSYHRCFADYPRTYGFHIGGNATIVTMTDCSVLQAGFSYGTAGVNGSATAYRIESAQVYLHSPRAENSQNTGFSITGSAKVTIDSIYCEGNRLIDIALDSTFSGEMVINGGRMIHDNSGVTTFACIKNASTEKCYIYINGIEYKLGPVTNNATTSGFYYAEDTTPYAVIEGLNVGSDVSKMSTGNKRVVYLSQSSRYAPAEFTVTDLPRVRFYRSGISHIAKINTGALPTTLNISDGTNTHDMLTNGSIAEVSGRKYVWNATKGAWALMSPRTYANINYKNSNDAPSNWWGTHQGTDIVRFGGGSATTTVVIDTTGANVGATYFVKTQSSATTPSTITINDHNGSLIYTLTPSFVGAGSVTATFAYYDRDGVGSGFQLVDKFRGD